MKYIVSPEAQAVFATSSCFWGMPANSKAGDQLSSDQKTALRWDQQADHAARTQLYPAPDADRDTDMQDLWLETLHSERQQKRPGLCGPCPDLDSSIFILRLLVMGAMLRAVLDRRNFSVGEVSVVSDIETVDIAAFETAVKVTSGDTYSPLPIETDITPVSYTHLTLPTIYSV